MKTNFQKTIIALFLIITLIGTYNVGSPVFAVNSEEKEAPASKMLKDNTNDGKEAGVTQLAKVILRKIDQAQKTADKAIEKINKSNNIDDETKQKAINTINDALEEIIAYKDKIEDVKTMDEFKMLNKEVLDTLQDFRATIRDVRFTSIVSIGKKMNLRLEDLNTKLLKLDDTVNEFCPEELETFREAQNKVEAEIQVLQQLIDLDDAEGLKTELKEVKTLMGLVKKDLEQSRKQCKETLKIQKVEKDGIDETDIDKEEEVTEEPINEVQESDTPEETDEAGVDETKESTTDETTSITKCTDGTKTYDIGESYRDECNVCLCTKRNGVASIVCTDEKCM